MLWLNLRSALNRPGRTLLVLLAVAAIVAEILILEGFLAGSYTQLRRAVLNRGGDVIVAQAGVRNFLAARSVLPQQTRAAVEAVPGVAATHPLALLSLIYEQDGRLTPIIVLVTDDKGAAERLVSGRQATASAEIVIDRSLADRYGLAPGDVMTLADYDFTVVGIAEGSAALFTPFAFLSFDGLIDFYFASDVAVDIAAFPLLSFLLVDVAPGSDPAQVVRAIEAAVPEAGAILPSALAANDVRLGRELLAPILNLLLALSYGAGALAIGLFMFVAVRGRRKSLGVLRALGFTTRHLVAGVIAEAVVIAVLAFPFGLVLARGFAVLIEARMPVYLVEIGEPSTLFRTAFVVLAMAALGALSPLRSLMRLDPASAFRG